jgi:hypothetical protein
VIQLNPTSAVAASSKTPDITISGLSLSDGYSSLSKVLKVKTSSDTNETGVTIAGI